MYTQDTWYYKRNIRQTLYIKIIDELMFNDTPAHNKNIGYWVFTLNII